MKHRRFWRLCIAIALLASSASHADAGAIGIDALHLLNPEDNLFDGTDYHDFRQTIVDLGHTIHPLYSFEASDLDGLDAIILRIPIDPMFQDLEFPEFTKSEIGAIHSFVNRKAVFLSDNSIWADAGVGDRPIDFGNNRLLLSNAVDWISHGGGGLFLGDYAGGEILTNFNDLVAQYGIRYTLNERDPMGKTITNLAPHSVTSGVNSIGVDYHVPMYVASPARDLTGLGEGQAVLAVFEIPEPSTFAAIAAMGLKMALARSRASRRYRQLALRGDGNMQGETRVGTGIIRPVPLPDATRL